MADETTGLSESSVEHRSSAVRTWLAVLPEIEVEGPQTAKTNALAGDADDQSSLGSFGK